MRRLLPGVLALCLALTACSGGEDEPAPTLEPLASSATPSPTGAAVPSEAAAATPDGAAEFARFYYESIEAGFQSRDASTVAELSAEGCEICQRYVDSIARLSERDERLEGNEITIREAVAPGDAGPTAVVTVVYDNTASRRFDAQGNVILEEPARENVVVELVLARVADSWQVEEVR